ncbi:UNVERIFIED_CONTAM: hypothetical protein FKN15_059103 [Acipenser sinensis]
MSAKASLPLAAVCVWAVVIGWARCQDWGSCLKGGKHKLAPGPEPLLQECQLYSDSEYKRGWKKQTVETRCEGFLKRMSCFYRCSPDAARWPHPSRPAAIQAVPLCLRFCQQWKEKFNKGNNETIKRWDRRYLLIKRMRFNKTVQINDSIKSWTSDKALVCVSQMYGGGRELCQSLWGDSFLAVPEEEGSCACLTLNASDREVMEDLQGQEGSPEELDTTKSGLPVRPAPCGQPRSATAPPLSGRRQRKRSIFIEDVEGSGSGF